LFYLRLLHGTFTKSVNNRRIADDLIHGEVRISAIPNNALRLRLTSPCLELHAARRSIVNKTLCSRKTNAVTPRQCKSTGSLVHEIIKITLPASVEVTEKQQATRVTTS